MHQSNWSFNFTPRATSQAFELLKMWLACSNSALPSEQKSRSNAPPISTEIPLLNRLQTQISSLIKHCSCFSQRDLPLWHLQTSFKDPFERVIRKQSEILSCKSVKPCKTRKNSGRAYYTRRRDKSGSNSPPFQGNVQITPSPGTMHSKMPGVCPGGMLKLQFDRYITKVNISFWI